MSASMSSSSLITFRDMYLERSRPKIFQISSWMPPEAPAARLGGRLSYSESDPDPSYLDGDECARLVGACVLEPVVILLFSGAGRGNLVPWEETFEAVLGVDSEEENEGVLETVGRGDDDLVVPCIMSGR